MKLAIPWVAGVLLVEVALWFLWLRSGATECDFNCSSYQVAIAWVALLWVPAVLVSLAVYRLIAKRRS